MTSPAPQQIEGLWWIMFWVTGGLASLVIGILVYAVYRARRADAVEEGHELQPGEQRLILLAGAALPAVVLGSLVVLSVGTGSAVSHPPGEPELTVEVTGHQFWWEVAYPELGITTANEIHIPVGVPVRVRVTSADVIHSFWVPRLSPGKIDMTPGRTTYTWMLAEEADRYRGQCTEFCGVQHALMSLLVIALPEPDFRAWVAARQRPRPVLEDAAAIRGRGIFVREGCASCHQTGDAPIPTFAGNPGPDLTHLASRETLAALTLPNDPEHRAAWIVDPHAFKAGVRMPATFLGSDDLEALLAYLDTLR